jgi:hypothetical protein
LTSDALRIITDSFELEIDSNGGINGPQRSSHRLLPNEESQADLVEFALHFVHTAVSEYDGVSDLPMSPLEGLESVR